MFETTNAAELPFSGVVSPDSRFWSQVQLSLSIPWFFCEYEITSGINKSIRNVIFLTNIEQLLQLHQHPDLELLQVDLVSPEYINKKGRWLMQTIFEIWAWVDPKTCQKILMYIFQDGTRYLNPEISEEPLIGLSRIFPSLGQVDHPSH